MKPANNVLIGSVTTTDDIGKLTVTGAKTGKALVVLNETGDQNILSASASGVTKFVLDRTGTITTGIWNGTKISEAYGGTNQSTYTTGDLCILQPPTLCPSWALVRPVKC